MKERLTTARVPKILLVAGLGLASLSACGDESNNSEATVDTTYRDESVTPEESQVELYPLETGNEYRSEVLKVITLDDGRKITCIESHILHPYIDVDGGRRWDAGSEYDIAQDCDIESLAQQTTTTSTPR